MVNVSFFRNRHVFLTEIQIFAMFEPVQDVEIRFSALLINCAYSQWKTFLPKLQVNLVIMLSLGSVETDCVISELCL